MIAFMGLFGYGTGFSVAQCTLPMPVAFDSRILRWFSFASCISTTAIVRAHGSSTCTEASN